MGSTENTENAAAMPADVQSRMQEILARHGEAYRRDLPGFVEKLRVHADALRAGTNALEATASLEREAHDMKGQAATFGLPGIAAVADSLSRVVSIGTVPGAADIAVIDAHVAGLEILLAGENTALVESLLAKTQALRGPSDTARTG